MAWAKQAGTAHSATCSKAFGRLDASCPRCQELAQGAPARNWGQAGRQQELRVLAAISAHDCKASHCGPVCTAFEW